VIIQTKPGTEQNVSQENARMPLFHDVTAIPLRLVSRVSGRQIPFVLMGVVLENATMHRNASLMKNIAGAITSRYATTVFGSSKILNAPMDVMMAFV
jgi:hypothetical protein